MGSVVAPGLHGVKGPARASASLRVLARAAPVPLTPFRPGAPAWSGIDAEASLPQGQRRGESEEVGHAGPGGAAPSRYRGGRGRARRRGGLAAVATGGRPLPP